MLLEEFLLPAGKTQATFDLDEATRKRRAA
jgi:hypothetical protein